MVKAPDRRSSQQQRLRRIEGRHNPLIKELRQAFVRGERTAGGDCAIEGLRVVEEAIRSSLKFRAVFFRESAQNMKIGYLPKFAGPREEELLASISAPTVRS